MTSDERLAVEFPVGSRVEQRGYGVIFTVVGYWRGNVRLQEETYGTTHCALPSDLFHADDE